MTNEEYEDRADSNPWTVSLPDCVVCDDRGCEFCQAVPEEWPAEAFKHFGIVDLQSLVLAAQAELYRRHA